MNIRNFNPGPAVLPSHVIEQAKSSLLNFAETGMGILEVSHRSDEYLELQQKTVQRLRSLLDIPSDYHILFCQGGATTQFSLVPMNLIGRGSEAAYISTGVWSEKAIQESMKFGKTLVVASSKADNFSRIPSEYTVPEQSSYLHFTSNNTIYGTQFHTEPVVPNSVPLVADASSDLLCRPLNIKKYGLIYASAQKNLGPAGVTVVIVKKTLLDSIPNGLPILCDYRTYAKHDSLYNTPPTFSIYVTSLVLEWIESLGGLNEIYQRNMRKARAVYDVIDEFDLYRGCAEPQSRSLMNVTFTLPTPELEEQFLTQAEEAGFIGLSGHRLVGGIRASMYNALEMQCAEDLAEFMRSFARKN